jgi:signal transduction histidine kinase
MKLNHLRFKLTLINAGVLAGLLALIFILLYISLSVRTATDTEQNLKLASAQLTNNINYLKTQKNGGTVSDEEGLGYQELKESLAKNGIYFVIWEYDFEILDYSGNSEYHSQFKSVIQEEYFLYQIDYNDRYYIEDYQINDNNYTVSTYLVVLNNGEAVFIQTFENTEVQNDILGYFTTVLIVSLVLGVSLSIIIGYFLSSRSLVPIKKSIEQQEKFLADASHELRTPIAVVQTNLEVVKSNSDESMETQMDWIENAYEETQRMQKIVNDLLFLARADAGEILIDNEPVDLTYLTKDIAEKLLPLAAKKDIFIYHNIDEELEITGDYGRIQQLFVILVDNAIKYSQPKSDIYITGKQKNGQIQISVIDHGIGMSKEEAKNAFSRFYRADKARSREMGGTGLGLSIAKWIVSEHSGNIRILSEKGTGTTVEVTFSNNWSIK